MRVESRVDSLGNVCVIALDWPGWELYLQSEDDIAALAEYLGITLGDDLPGDLDGEHDLDGWEHAGWELGWDDPTFDRFDIAAAYWQLLSDYNRDGLLHERDTRGADGRARTTSVQLGNMRYSPGMGNPLDESSNARAIYAQAAQRLGLPGYCEGDDFPGRDD